MIPQDNHFENLVPSRRKWLSAVVTGVTMGVILMGNALFCGGAAAQDLQAAGETAKKCLVDLYYSPAAAPLRPHLPMDPKSATLSQLSNPAYATAPEIAAIQALHPRYIACRHPIVTILYNAMPSVGQFLQRAYSAADDDLILLIQRRISWGESITRWRNRTLTTEAELQRQLGAVALNFQQQNQAEMARRAEQQQSAALLEHLRSQQLLETARLFSEMGRPSRLPYGAYELPSSGLHCAYGGGYMNCH